MYVKSLWLIMLNTNLQPMDVITKIIIALFHGQEIMDDWWPW